MTPLGFIGARESTFAGGATFSSIPVQRNPLIYDTFRAPCISLQQKSACFASSALNLSPADAVGNMGEGPYIWILAVVALAIGFAAQTFVNSMLKGDQGLGAFLSDGSGYKNSSFKSRKGRGSASNSDEGAPLSGEDPLPWLRLPKFDFVEVAGQEYETATSNNAELPSENSEKEAKIVARLEGLADLMKVELKAGNIEEATRLQNQLEKLMAQYGFEFKQ